jgi:hypothetical protein
LKNVLFVTTLNLSTNPRLVKEIDLACNMGMNVQVICFRFQHWSTKMNLGIKKRYPQVDFIEIDAGRKPLFPWLFSVSLEKLGRWLYRFGITNHFLLTCGVSRRSILLMQKPRRIRKADWVIAHNPGAMYPALKFAKRFSAKTGFDMEDYHPGEGSDKNIQLMTALLFKKTLGLFDYITFASPVFQAYTQEKYPLPVSQSQEIVLNGFFSKEFVEPLHNQSVGTLQLVWFSQNVSFGRGLEALIPLLGQYLGKIELHLYGNMDPEFKKQILSDKPYVFHHGVLNQQDLHKAIGKYHVGIALEPGTDMNNSMLVSNKFMTYLQSGLYILATETMAQSLMLNKYPAHGLLIDPKMKNLKEALESLLKQSTQIMEASKHRFLQMRSVSWEVESEKIKALWTKS